MPAAAVTVVEGSEEGGSDSGGQGMGSRVRLAAAGSAGKGSVAAVAQGGCSAGCGKPGLGCGLGGWGRKKYEVN